MEVNGAPELLFPTFFRISSFVFSRTKTFIQVQNYLSVSKWQDFHFWVNYPLNIKCDQILSRIYISKLPKQLCKHASVTHLEAAEVLNAPDFDGAIRWGRGQDLVHRRELNTPNTSTMTSEDA